MKRDEWTEQFVEALVLEYRKDLEEKFAHIIAATQWQARRTMDPRKAACQWTLEKKPPEKK
jgi:hypothetical protein